MAELTLNAAQAALALEGSSPIVVRDEAGGIIGYLHVAATDSPVELSVAEIEELVRRTSDENSQFVSTRELLDSLQEPAQRAGR